MRQIPIGKIPVSILQRIVFRNLGIPSDRLLVGPSIGEDAAVVRIGKIVVALSTDPITGSSSNIGWLSVHVNANDIATRGAKPKWYLCSIILPENTRETTLHKIMNQIDRACVELGVTVAGGHSEVTALVEKPMIVGFMVGEINADNYFTSAGVTAGDSLIMTKSAGIEGTAIIAMDQLNHLRKYLDMKILRRAQLLYRKISVVEDAMISVKTKGVDAMHDPTEGGLLCGVWELAQASKVGVRIYAEHIPVSPETDAVCRCLGINPLRLLSSGSLLIAANPLSTDKILSRLSKKGIPANKIGEFTSKKKERVLIHKLGKATPLKPPFPDEIYDLIN